MRIRPFRDQHPVHIVHRGSALVLGLGLWVFAALGFAHGLAFFSTQGQQVLGLSSNGLLSSISLAAGAVLLAGAVLGGPAASSVTAGLGAVFLLAGLVHLAILHTQVNILAFTLPNVFFSLLAGMLLLFTGLYGRVSGGLPPDNPYRQAHPSANRPNPQEQLDHRVEPDSSEQEVLDAELAMGAGHPSLRQQRLVEQELALQRQRDLKHTPKDSNDTTRRSDPPRDQQ